MTPICTILVAFLACSLWGEGGPSGQQPTESKKPELIDGSKNPELIPDAVAVQNLFGFLCDGPSARSWSSRVEYLSPSGLNKDEITEVLLAANAYGAAESRTNGRLRTLHQENRGKAWSEQVKSEIKSLLGAQTAEAARISSELQKSLSPSTYNKLLEFVRTKHKSTMLYHPGIDN